MTSSTVTSSASSDAKLQQTIGQIRNVLQQQQNQQDKQQQQEQHTANLKQCTKSLQEEFKASEVMEYLASCLFVEAAGLNSQDALSVLYFLVSSEQGNNKIYLKEASRAVKAEALRLASGEQGTTTTIIVSPQLLQIIIAQLSGIDVQVSTNATETLVACCKTLGSQSATTQQAIQLVSGSLEQVWNQLVGNDKSGGLSRSEASTICIRCVSTLVELITELDGDGDHAMEIVMSTKTMDIILRMMTDGSDPLLQMSILDLLEPLATKNTQNSPKRAQWLFSDQLLYPLLQMAGGGSDSGGADPILGGPALRLVSSLCKVGQLYPHLFFHGNNTNASSSSMFTPQQLLSSFHRALQQFQCTNENDRLAIIDAISSFASTSHDALELVLDDPVTRKAWLSLDVAQPKLKSAILTSVAFVIDPPTQQQQTQTQTQQESSNNNNSMHVLKLYGWIGQTNHANDSTDFLLNLAKSPILDERLGSYIVLKAVATLGLSGPQVLLAHADFYQFLISSSREHDNSVETHKIGREAKFAILQAIMNGPVKGMLANDIVTQLEKILNRGPHYIQAQRYDVDTAE